MIDPSTGKYLGPVRESMPHPVKDRGKNLKAYFKSRAMEKLHKKFLARVPSMAGGGMVHAPKHKGKLVILHNGEMVVPARKVKAIKRAMADVMRRTNRK